MSFVNPEKFDANQLRNEEAQMMGQRQRPARPMDYPGRDAREAFELSATATPEGLRALVGSIESGDFVDVKSITGHLECAAQVIEDLQRHIQNSTIQSWVSNLPKMQQSCLLSATRGCDGLAKGHRAKRVVRFFRRTIFISAFEGIALTDPFHPGGGDFTGPIAEIRHEGSLWTSYLDDGSNKTFDNEHDARCDTLAKVADDFLKSRDDLHQHYYEHMMHAFEIIGYKHPDDAIRDYFLALYIRIVRAKHLYPEKELQLDERLGDDPVGWQRHSDEAGSCST